MQSNDDLDQRPWAAAALVALSDTLDVETMSATLGLEPNRTWRKGTRMSAGNPRSAIRTHSGCVWTSELDSTDPFLDHVDAVIEEMEPYRDHLTRLADHCTLDLFCGYGPGRHPGKATLDHAGLQRLGQLPVSLTLDFYGPGGGVPIVDVVPGLRLPPTQRWHSGALALSATSLPTAALTALLGLAAAWPVDTQADRAPIDTFSTLRSERPHWMRESGLPYATPLEDHIQALLDVSETKAAAFHHVREQASIELRLCYASTAGQGGFWCDHATIKRLAALPFDLTFEVTTPPHHASLEV